MERKERAMPKLISIDVPYQARSFLLKALILFVGWKLLYHLVLFPVRFPDRYLTHFTASSTGWVYHILGKTIAVRDMADDENNYSSSVLFLDGKRAVGVVDPCNGLELHILYIGFLLCVPGKHSKKIAYIITGIAVIAVFNTLRIAALAWLNMHYISVAYFAHHYVFKMVIYGIIFYLWVRFSKMVFKDAK